MTAFGVFCLILTAAADTDLAEEQYGVKYASKCEGNSYDKVVGYSHGSSLAV